MLCLGVVCFPGYFVCGDITFIFIVLWR